MLLLLTSWVLRDGLRSDHIRQTDLVCQQGTIGFVLLSDIFPGCWSQTTSVPMLSEESYVLRKATFHMDCVT